MKKILIATGLLLIAGGGIGAFLLGRSEYKADLEKCRELLKRIDSQVRPEDYTYVPGSGCVLKETLRKERGYFSQKSSKKGDENAVEESRERARDAKRVNDITNLGLWLSQYKTTFAEYPRALTQLNSLIQRACQENCLRFDRLDYDQNNRAYPLSSVDKSNPSNTKRPEDSYRYHYAVRAEPGMKITAYHLGASFETAHPNLSQDADFDSGVAGWHDGFSGNDQQPCLQDDGAKSCYDLLVDTSPPLTTIRPTSPPSPTVETSNWVVYRNTKYQYSFRYPASFTIYTAVDQTKEEVIHPTATSDKVLLTNNKAKLFCCEPLVTSVSVINGFIDTTNWHQYAEIPDYRITSQGEITFAGRKAFEVRGSAGIDSVGARVIVIPQRQRSFVLIQGDAGEPWESITNSFDLE